MAFSTQMIALDPATLMFIAIRQNTKKNANTEVVLESQSLLKKENIKVKF